MCRAAHAHRQIPKYHLLHHRARHQRGCAGRAQSARTHHGHRTLFRGAAGGQFSTPSCRQKPFRFGAGGGRVRDDGLRHQERARLCGDLPVGHARARGRFRRYSLRERQPLYERGDSDPHFQSPLRAAPPHEFGRGLQPPRHAHRRVGKALRHSLLELGRLYQRHGRHQTHRAFRRSGDLCGFGERRQRRPYRQVHRPVRRSGLDGGSPSRLLRGQTG